MKKFVTEDSFWQLFPGASLGVIVARGMKPANEISPEDAQAIEQLLSRANALAEKHLESSTLSENAPVRAWRQAYQQFKTKRGARCSIENLLKRVLKGNPVGSISPSVDLYNAISLKYALPLGGEDLDAFEGDLRLRITEGGDAFTPLGEGAENDPTLPGELAYVDDAGAVCRCWNWRDGVRTALTDNTAMPSSSSNASIPSASRTAAPPPKSSRSSLSSTWARPSRSQSSLHMIIARQLSSPRNSIQRTKASWYIRDQVELFRTQFVL